MYIYIFRPIVQRQYSQGSKEQYSHIGSQNGLVPIRQQVIIWTNGGNFTDGYMRYFA